jgi:hypothetical protein
MCDQNVFASGAKWYYSIDLRRRALMGDTVKKVVDNTKDAINEVSHRTNAEVEHVKRDVAGDEMTAGEKVKSVVKEGSERTKAEIDKAKREVRERT